MPAKKDKKIKLVSTANTGYFYTTKNSRSDKKLELMKFDPVAGKYVKFKQSKIK